jgi:hypothetical protein
MQIFINNFESTFIASVKDTPGTAEPATELDYGVLRLSDGAAAFLTNPVGGDFYVLTAYKRDGTLETNQEIVRVTAIDNTHPGECRITVLRGQEGTSAKAYLAGDRLSLRLTAGAVNNWVAQFDIAKDNANTATTQADIATTQAGLADSSRIAAQAAAADAAASYDAFDDRNLGAKASDPTQDNDGNALLEGALYWNTTVKEWRTWDGTAWVTTSVANAVSRAGDTMTGPLSVPAGASGAQVPQAQEVVPQAGNVTMTGPLSVPAGASGAQVPQAQEIGALADAQLTTHYKRSNILGTVSQTAGVPTGAIIEQGSNVNGRYVRWADGTQVCTHQMAGTTAGDGVATWTLPASFSYTPRVFAGVNFSASTQTGQVRTVVTEPTGASTAKFKVWVATDAAAPNFAASAASTDLLAIGRWF